jgi:hypothetical protein
VNNSAFSDYLISYCKIGSTVYFGPALASIDYFSKLGLTCKPFTNPADFLLDLLDEEPTDDERPQSKLFIEGKEGESIPQKLIANYRTSHHNENLRVALENLKNTP